MQQDSDNPTKKPVATIGFEADSYRRSAIRHWLYRAETEPDSKKRKAILDYVLTLSRPLRKQAGLGLWWRVGFAAVCAGLLVAWLALPTRRTYFFSTQSGSVLRITRNLDPCLPDGTCGHRFVVQRVENGLTYPEAEMHFCTDFEPHFEMGHQFAWIRYTEMGSCESLANGGYGLLRGSDGLPILAPNCSFDWPNKHNRCQGGKAEF